jgi:phage-related protein
VIYYIDKDKLEYFTFGGTSSASFNFIIMENDNLSSFENDFELISVPGRTGDLIVNNNRKKNKAFAN